MKIAPDLAAQLVGQLPPRLIKRLDAEPRLAERWTWAGDTVTTDKGEVVRLAATAGIVTDVTCSCLLAPRCLHVGAVVALLEPAGEAAAELAPAPVTLEPDLAADPAQVSAARRAFAVAADVLATGAEASGAVVQAELLRAIHACRTAGLHRLAATTTRMLRSIRELRADRPEFALATLAADLRDALGVALAIAAGDATAALVGTARRDYEPAGGLQLYGLFSEAVVARTGHAGVVTYLVDASGRIYSRADVAPGDAARAAAAYGAPTGLGDAVLPHRELGRAGLFIADATVSADGRLGAGAKVRAVRAAEPARWDRIAPRFAEPLAQQIARLARTRNRDETAGSDLVFVTGTLAGATLAIGAQRVELVTTHDHPGLAARDNLAVLARTTPGIAVRAIGRARLGAPHRLELLAIGPAPDEARLVLPGAWHGRANVDFDRLALSRGARAPAFAPPEPPADLLAALHRRIERVVLGGVGTLPTQALAELDREAAALADRALGGGAQALRDLGAMAQSARARLDRPAFARAWLRAALYEDAARRRFSVARWTA